MRGEQAPPKPDQPNANASAMPADSGPPSACQWSLLTKGQLGRCTEWLASIEFMLHGFEVYATEVDDRGVDLIVRTQDSGFEVQVKGLRPPGGNCTYFRKRYFEPRPQLLAAIGVYRDGEAPGLYLVPSMAWQQPRGLLNDGDFGDGRRASQSGALA